MSPNNNQKQSLGLLSLVLIAVVSVDSLRNLPIAAQYGFSLVTFYAIAGLTFFLPLAWITARLVKQYPELGGSYVWIKRAFGHRFGYLSILLQWLYNMIWYPTIFAFITATLAPLISHDLENNKWFILITSLVLFWLLSFLHCKGIRTSSWISGFSAIIGTLIPMLLIISFAVYWLLSGKPSATPLTWSALLPGSYDFKNIGFFSNILFSLLGLEVIAMHASNVYNPRKTYPVALGISAILILLTIMCSSLALCVIMPAEKIILVSGLIDVLQVFFSAYHIQNISTIIGACIIIGSLGIASSWMIGLARGLQVALSSMNAPDWLQRLNKNQMPSGVLFFQAVVFSFLLCSFLFFPNINHSYWILSAITAQFALSYYVLLFLASIKLLRQKKQSPINNILSIVLPGMGIIIGLLGVIVGFIPPDFMVK